MTPREKGPDGKFIKKGAGKAWTPPDVCPECGNPGIIPVIERQSIACPDCRREIPCE